MKENKNEEQLLPLKEAATGGYGITVTGLPPPSKDAPALKRQKGRVTVRSGI